MTKFILDMNEEEYAQAKERAKSLFDFYGEIGVANLVERLEDRADRYAEMINTLELEIERMKNDLEKVYDAYSEISDVGREITARVDKFWEKESETI